MWKPTRESISLYHHGILGQRWGVRRTPEELGRHVRFRQSKMSIDEYKHACELWKMFPELKKIPDPKNWVLSAFSSNLSAAEKEQSIVHTDYNNHQYTAINKGGEQYKIIKYEHISGAPISVLDEVLSEVVGNDWREYDDE